MKYRTICFNPLTRNVFFICYGPLKQNQDILSLIVVGCYSPRLAATSHEQTFKWIGAPWCTYVFVQNYGSYMHLPQFTPNFMERIDDKPLDVGDMSAEFGAANSCEGPPHSGS